jgi:hypothetical protein
MPHQNLCRGTVLFVERGSPRQHFIKNNGHRIQVAPKIQCFSEHLLWADILRRPHQHASLGQIIAPIFHHDFRNPKVGDLGPFLPGSRSSDENIRWFDIPMNDLLSVGFRQTLQNLTGEFYRPLRTKRTFRTNTIREG